MEDVMPRGFLDEEHQVYGDGEDADRVDWFGNSVGYNNATCVRQTEKAICVSIGGKERWLPQAAIHDDSEVYAQGHSGRPVIKAWFAQKEGLRGDGE
jgi:hypothetical protein